MTIMMKKIESPVLFDANTCIDCLYSRINSTKIDLLKRTCSLQLELFNENCIIMRESFSEKIRNRKSDGV